MYCQNKLLGQIYFGEVGSYIVYLLLINYIYLLVKRSFLKYSHRHIIIVLIFGLYTFTYKTIIVLIID